MITQLSSQPDDTNKLKTYLNLGNFFSNDDTTKRNYYYSKLFVLASTILKESNNSIEKISAKNYKGIVHLYVGIDNMSLGNYDRAILFYDTATTYFTETKNLSKLSETYINKGIILFWQGKYIEAANYYQEAMAISEKLKDTLSISNCLNNLSVVYILQENYPPALEYNNKALELYKSIKDSVGIAYAINNTGNIYFRQKDYENALIYYAEALDINRKMRNEIGQTKCLNNLGLISKTLKKYVAAIGYYKDAIQISDKLNDYIGLASTYNNLGTVYSLSGNHEMAVVSFEKSLKAGFKVNAKNEIKDTYMSMAAAYEKTRDFEKAFYSHIKFYEYSDSLYNEGVTNKLNELEAKYQNEKKKAEIELLNTENQLKSAQILIQDEQNQRQRIIIIITAAGLLILLAFFFAILRLMKQKQKANELLKKQKTEIEEKNKNLEYAYSAINQQKEEIQTQAEQLAAINKELEKLSIVASKTDNSIIIADAEGNIEWANLAFTKLTGYSLEEYTATFGKTIIEVSSCKDIECIVDSCIKTKKTAVYTGFSTTRDGKEIWLQTTLTPILDSLGNLSKLVAIDTDITAQKEAEFEITRQRDQISEINQELSDSIEYGGYIQSAVLTPVSVIKTLIPQSFVFYRPKDVVSGDFYWVNEIDNKIVIAAADCTGHGIPGAFMSMLGMAFLNDIVVQGRVLDPGKILSEMRSQVVRAMHQTGVDDETKDGMVMGICVIAEDRKKMTFSGAKLPLIKVSDDQLTEFKPDRMPISIYHIMNDFSNTEIELSGKDRWFMFSDGYQDQFGGENADRLKKQGLLNLLKETSRLEIEDQYNRIDEYFRQWKGDFEQIDDVLIMGYVI